MDISIGGLVSIVISRLFGTGTLGLKGVAKAAPNIRSKLNSGIALSPRRKNLEILKRLPNKILVGSKQLAPNSCLRFFRPERRGEEEANDPGNQAF